VRSSDLNAGRGAPYPIALLTAADEPNSGRTWNNTLVRDEYKAYERVVAAEPGRLAARCLAPARSMFDELLRDNGKNAVTTEALQCITRI
jgi:transposase